MGWLFGKKKDNILDLTERYRKKQEKMIQESREAEAIKAESTPVTGFGIFGMQSTSTTSTSNSDSGIVDVSNVDEKRRKLAKRIMVMTEKIEDLSNQIYHLQQRVEVLEKKGGHTY